MVITMWYIGSASLKGNRYRNDYDIDGLFKSTGKKDVVEKYLYKVFLNKFNEAYKTNNVWITDFKCGMDSDGENLRWDYKDMKKGFKVMSNGRKILFTECLLQKSMMKMDIVSIVDGIMTEFSEKYYITIGGESNFLELEILN